MPEKTSIEPVLRAILREIEPTPTQKEGARRSHNFLRDILCTGKMEPRIITSYLSGSYARATAVYPLDDVDIIFIIDPSMWSVPLFSSKPPPRVVLRSFSNAIRRRYSESSVRTQRRSVRLQLNHLNIDVVPAIDRDDGSEMIDVADRNEDVWISSSPKRHSDNANRLNQERDGNFKPLVKLLKSWNGGLPKASRFKSFAIETIAVRLFQSLRFDTLSEGLVLFFDFIAYLAGESTTRRWNDRYGVSFGLMGSEAPDTAGTGSNVLGSLARDRRSRFVTQAIRARRLLLEAHNHRTEESAWRTARRALKAV